MYGSCRKFHYTWPAHLIFYYKEVWSNNIPLICSNFLIFKGMRGKGSFLNSHRLWREISGLDGEERRKVLDRIINKELNIREAIQVIHIIADENCLNAF